MKSAQNHCPVDWTKIDTVLLDMDGTLLDLHYDNYFWLEFLPQKISLRDGISLRDAKDTIVPILLESRGTLPFYCIEHWSRVFDIDILALKYELSYKISLRNGAKPFLQRMREAGKTLVLATNAHRSTVDLKLEKTGLGTFFNAISCSHDYGHAKEDAAYWKALERDKHIDFAHCLFVDDNHEVLATAAACGVAHLLSIRTPDSQRPPVKANGYPMTDNFGELLPDTHSM